jgi:urea carboxylase
MIYETPRISPGGDRYVLIEFGDEMDLSLNFKGQALAKLLEQNRQSGVLESAPCFASTLVHYEPQIIGYDDVVVYLNELCKELGPSDDIELNSRLFYIPAMYLDPWTEAAINDYRENINSEKIHDPDFVAQLNNLKDAEHLVKVHSGTEYWIASLGFWPGLPFMMPLDPRCKLTAPKDNPPRTWTPKGSIGMGGGSTAIYPENLPGGYQIFARTPIPIWDTNKSFSVFENNICLFQPGDRVKFVPCDKLHFEDLEQQVKDQSYIYNVIEYQKFSVKNYRQWVSGLKSGDKFKLQP